MNKQENKHNFILIKKKNAKTKVAFYRETDQNFMKHKV